MFLSAKIYPSFKGGGKVLGVIPEALKPRELIGSNDYGEMIIVESMHERKFTMYKNCDAFVALPGGFGTLDELLEVLYVENHLRYLSLYRTWAQLGIHKKPIGLLNTCGYFDGILEWIKNSVKTNLLSQQAADLLLVSDNPKELFEKLEFHKPIESKFSWSIKV